MRNSLSHQQPKAEPKWQGIFSLVLGVTSTLANASYMLLHSTLIKFWFVPAAGIVLGIIGLKYIKKALAIMGIVLSSISLLAYTLMDVSLRLMFG